MRTNKSYQKGIVALVDFLGVSQFSLEECDRFITNRDQMVRDVSKFTEMLLGGNDLPSKGIKIPKLITFADNILLTWQLDELDAKALNFVTNVLGYVFMRGIREHKYIMRGAVSMGD